MKSEFILNENLLRPIIDNAQCGISIIVDGCAVYTNWVMSEYSGYSPQELEGRKFWNILSPGIHDKIIKQDLIRPEAITYPSTFEVPLLTKDGQNFWIKLTTANLEIDNQKLILLFAFDITSRKQIELELRKSETCFRQMTESVRDIFWVSDRADNRLFYISPIYEEIYGRPCEEMYLNSEAYLKYVHPQDKERVLNRFRDPDLETDAEYRMFRPDGSIRWLRSKSFPVRDMNGKVYRTVGITSDITEEKILRSNLLNSQEQLKHVILAIEGGVWEIDMSNYAISGKFPDEIYISPDLKRMIGYEDSEFPNRLSAWNARMHPEDRLRLDQMTLQHLKYRSDVHETDYRIRHKDGRWLWLHTRSQLRKDENGKVIYWTGIDCDITKKKEAEMALSESEELLSHTISIIKGGIWKLDLSEYQEGDALPDDLYMAPCLKELIGYADNEFPNSTYAWREIIYPDDLDRYVSTSSDHLSGKTELFEIDYRVKHRNGSLIWLHTRSKIERDENGNPLRWIGIDYDITKNKEAEIALRASENFNKTMIAKSPIGVAVRNPFRQLLNCNEAWRKIWNRSEGDVQAMMAQDKTELSLEYLGKWAPQVERIYQEGGYLDIPELYVTRSSDHVELWVSQRFYAIKDEAGQVERVVILTDDITERKRTEIALKNSEATLKSVFDAAPIGIGLTCNRRINWANQHMANILGYSNDELKGMSTRLIYENEQKYSEIGKIIKNTVLTQGYASIESRLVRKDGKIVDVNMSASLIDQDSEIPLLVFTVMDITERKRAESAVMLQRDLSLRLNAVNDYENSYKIMLEFCLKIDEIDCGSMYILDEKKKLLHLVQQQGLSEEFVKTVTDYELDTPEAQLVLKGSPVYINFAESKFHKSEVSMAEGLRAAAILPISVEDEIIACIILASHSADSLPENACLTLEAIASTMGRVIGRINSQEAQQASDERFRAVFETAKDIIFIKDTNLRYTDVNPEFERLLGLPSQAIIGWTEQEIFGDTNSPADIQLDQKVLKGEIIELELNGPKGFEERIYTTIKVPLRDSQEQIIGLCGISRDVTETRKLQEFSARAMRLETAGRIAGQVAHDFNNLLGPLVAYPDLIKDELSDCPEVHGFLDDMKWSAQQISDINQQLLTLGRRGHYNLAVMNINDSVNQAVKKVYPAPPALQIETSLEPELMNINGGSSQILRVLSNLITNSRDALDDIGKITITTENFLVDRQAGKYGRAPVGEYVRVSVCDNGIGIPTEVLPKIFEPFYTTKNSSRRRGSGLGLSVVHAVMKDHDGYVDVESVEGEGTSVCLYFPITLEEIGKNKREKIVGGDESILVVDDDLVQREVAHKLLNRLGYKANMAESGERALELIRQNNYDLILLDMIMPEGLDGTETYRQALKINPLQKAIIVSGFAESSRVSAAIKLGVGGFIKKPLTLKTIANAVRRELDKKEVLCNS